MTDSPTTAEGAREALPTGGDPRGSVLEQPAADDGPDLDVAADETSEGDPRLAKARGEARSLRTRLREAESERNAASELAASLARSVEEMQRVRVVELATGPGRLVAGEDLFLAGDLVLGDLLNEAGDVDEAKVSSAVQQLRIDRPHWGAPAARGFMPSRMPVVQLQSGASPADEMTDPRGSWSGALRGR